VIRIYQQLLTFGRLGLTSGREHGHGRRKHGKRTSVRTVIPMTKTKTLVFVTCGLVLFATGCVHPKIGPQSLPRDSALYSVSLADSWKNLTLLNIVKVRYLDPPVFVTSEISCPATRCSKALRWAGLFFIQDQTN